MTLTQLYTDPATGWMLPVWGGVITQGYGPEGTDPSVRDSYVKGYHTGIDIAGVPEGTPVISPGEGAVSFVGPNGGYGNCVIIDRDDGIAMLFGHLCTIAVQVGQRVVAGQEIGGVGNTGSNTTGVHLHYEYRRGSEDIDPTPFLHPNAAPVGLHARVTEALNLREGPSADTRLLGTAPAGAEVTIIRQGWYPVWWDGREGWMYGGFLDFAPPAASNGHAAPLEEAEAEPTVTDAAVATRSGVTTGRPNLRSGPGMEFPVLAVLAGGVAVELMSETGEWLEVKAAAGQGFVHASLVTLDGRTAPPRAGRTIASPNLRSGPGTAFPVLRELSPGTPLQVIEEQSGYLRVSAGGLTGFVHRDFVMLDEHAVVPGFLRTRPDLAAAPVEPPDAERINLDGVTGDVERRVAGAWNRYGGLLTVMSHELDIDAGVAAAVLAIEAGGRGLGETGKLIIRFESHIFFDHWGRDHPDVFTRHFSFDAERPWQEHWWRPSAGAVWADPHADQSSEWAAFEFACSLDDTAAKSSISMGAPQIMGFNCTGIGCESVQEMFDAFCAGERHQIIGFFDFVRGAGSESPRLLALQRQDFYTFAALYNGTGQVATYGSMMTNAFDAFKRLRA